MTLACSNATQPAPAVSTSAAAASQPVSPAPAPSLSPSLSPTPETQALTPAVAREALDAFLPTDQIVKAAEADKWALDLTRDGRRPITIAQIHARDGKAPVYTWGKRTVFVPRQSATRWPQWFAATAERRSASGEVRTVLLAFMRASASGKWQNSFESVLYTGQRAPDMLLDSDGYATALDSRDSSLAITPALMGPLHATVAEEGSQGYASGLIAPGPQTTGYAEQIAKEKDEARDSDCLAYESIFASAPNYPVFALRTADGGALILYTLIRTSSWSTDLGPKCGEGRPVPIPQAARWLLSNVIVHFKRQITETQQYVSAVPSKASTAPAHVIGYDGTITNATDAKSR
jgi:hypothetical protein